MLKYMVREHADIISEIEEKQALNDELQERIKQALTAFASIFQNLMEV